MLLWPAANVMHGQTPASDRVSWGILAHSSWAKTFTSQIFLGLRAAIALFKSHQRFSMGLKSGDCDGHPSIFQDFFWNQALVDFEVCLGSLSCWKVQCRQSFSFLTEGMTFFSQDFLILDWIHLALHTLQVSSARGYEAAPEHHWATTMLHCRQGDIFSVCFSLPPPDIPLIHRPQKFQFCFIVPQNRIPKPVSLIYIVFCKFKPTFLVLLGQ